MTKTIPIRRGKLPREEGYILVAVMFMLAILIIAMGAAAPKIARDIQRDRELETMHRGKQYTRAIQLFYRKFGAYPPNVDALLKTNEIRFLRQRYLDPVTGKDDWKPIMLGQNKTPLAMGFFGQPLSAAGSPFPGTVLMGSNGIASASPLGVGGGVDSSQIRGSASDSTSNSSFGSDSTGAPAGTDQDSDTSSASGTNPAGQTVGGVGIIGFSPASPKESILSYKKKNHYNEWEFLYSPLTDRMTVPNNPLAQPPLQGGAPGAPPQAPPSSAVPPVSSQ